jgi:hypothetical protein
LVIAAAPSLSGCGGGGGGNRPPSGGGGVSGAGTKGDPISATFRAATLSNVEAEFESLVGGGARFDPEAMVDFLKQQPAFHEVGYSAGSQCAWGVFTDGRKLMIINNVDPSIPPIAVSALQSRSQLSATAVQIPDISDFAQQHLLDTWQDPDKPLLVREQFRLINMWENAAFWTTQPLIDYLHVTQGWVEADTIPALGRMARGLGFDVIEQGVPPGLGFTVDRSRIGEVPELLNVSDDGVFFLTGSAGYFETADESIAAICTTTLAGTVAEEDYQQDIADGTLIYAMARDHLDQGPQTYLAFTPQFTRDHNWSFPEESLVFLNVTGGGIGQWLDSMLLAGAGLVLGWEDPPQQRTMLGVAQDFFELLFATNRNDSSLIHLEIEPRLRSYGIGETLDFLRRVHLLSNGSSNDVGNRLIEFPGISRPYIAQLRPSIEWVLANEDFEDTGEIMLQGQFGEESYSPSKVMIGTTTKDIKDPETNAAIPELDLVADQPLDNPDEFEIIEWRPNLIRVRGESLYGRKTGMIQIWQGKRFSNIAHLTHWLITFQITRKVGVNFLRSVSMEVNIRAFVSGYRLWPDQPLEELWVYTGIHSSKQGSVGWSASGSESSGGTTVSWAGAGNFNDSDLARGEYFRLDGLLLIKDKQLDCNLIMNVYDGLLVKTSTVDGVTEVQKNFSVKTPSVETSVYPSGLPKVGALSLYFDANWNLIPGNVIFSDNDESTPFSSNNNCETQIMWTATSPEFPPELDRGGR